MKHVDMRKLPAAAQEERRRQVIGLRQTGMAYDAIAAQVGLTRTGVFNIWTPPKTLFAGAVLSSVGTGSQ
jgi:hypothetical protein